MNWEMALFCAVVYPGGIVRPELVLGQLSKERSEIVGVILISGETTRRI